MTVEQDINSTNKTEKLQESEGCSQILKSILSTSLKGFIIYNMSHGDPLAEIEIIKQLEDLQKEQNESVTITP